MHGILQGAERTRPPPPLHPWVHSECYTFLCKSTSRLHRWCFLLEKGPRGFLEFSEVHSFGGKALPVQSLPLCVSELHTLYQAHPVFIYIFLVFCSWCFFFFLPQRLFKVSNLSVRYLNYLARLTLLDIYLHY